MKEIEKRNLRQRYRHISLKHLRFIGVDEIAIRKRHQYATIVVDLISGKIMWVAMGRNVESLKGFLRCLKRSRAKLEAVSMDMSPPYHKAVTDCFPRVSIVYDHFHIMQLMNRKLDELRMQHVRKVKSHFRGTVKGVRWLILMSAERLNQWAQEKPVYKKRLEIALHYNKPLATGYYLKEKLRLLWSLPTPQEGEAFLKDWCEEAKASRLEPLQEMAKILQRHREEILAYFKYPISNGLVEGIVHKIKTLKRMAYGYRDWEYFKLKLYALHEPRYKLSG